MDDKQSIILVTTHLGGGGAEKHLVRIANVLTQEYDVHVAVLRPNGSYTRRLSPEATLHELTGRLSGWRTIAACQISILRLRDLCLRVAPACIVSFLEPASYCSHAAISGLKIKPKLICGVQNNFDLSIRKFDRFYLRWFRSRLIKSLAGADHLVAISTGVRDGLQSAFPDSLSKISVINNAAVDESASGGACTHRPLGEFAIVSCGRLVRQKAFGDLLQAFRLIKGRLDCTLKILGTGPDLLNLKKQSMQLGISESVQFLGFQDDPNLFFRQAHLFLLSSHWEGFGNVIVEAMSCGVPVIATDCPFGPGEIITQGKNGVLVPVGCVESMAREAIALLNDPDRREQIAHAGALRALDFTDSVIASKYSSLIRQVTGCLN